jgi:hypothetical protein
MMLSARKGAGPLLAAALLALDAGGARAQGPIVRLPEADRALAGTAPQVFAIGKAEGAEHEMFGVVAGVAFDAAENLYVLDRQQARVMVYDRTGRYLRQIGRQGEGPGELMVPMQIAMSGDGTLIVTDLGRDAYSLFRPDGTFVRNVRFGGWTPAMSASTWHPTGAMVGTFRPRPSEELRAGQPMITNQSTPVMAFSLASGEARRVFEVPALQRVEQRNESTRPGETRVMFRISAPPAFTPAVLHGVLPNGTIALSFTSGYTVRIVDLNGQTLRYLQRPVRTRRTTQADRDRYLERRRAEIAAGRGGVMITRGGGAPGAPRGRSQDQLRQAMEQQLAETRFSDTIPALQGLRVSPSGKLLVERTGANVGDPGPVDVITLQGQYLGTFTGVGLPDAISRGGLAAFVEEDDDGVQRVVVRRLPSGWW